jgi:Tfp pilus assembly protein PilO
MNARLLQDLKNTNMAEASKTPAPAIPQAIDTNCQRLSISLFQTDVTRLNRIRTFMESHGKRISASHAIKLALRTSTISTELLTAMTEIEKEDGRGKR